MKSIVVLLTCMIFIPLYATTATDSPNTHQNALSSGESIVPSIIRDHKIESRDVLYYQIPDTLTAMGYRCQLDSVLPLEADIVDDIEPSGEGWHIDSVVAWFCNWGGFVSWGSVPNIHFLVYQDSSGQPADSPFIELVVEQSEYSVYNIATERWRVEMRLPIPIVLDTFRYWIEFQPSNSTPANGNTGNQAQVSIGNGQEFYMRFPLAGTYSWESATSLFGQPLETGFLLYGNIIGEYHDVGTQEIITPPLYILPGIMVNPEAQFRNHGNTNDTLDVHFTIDSAGINIYHEMYNINIGAGIDTNLIFPAWTAADTGDIVYNITVYTVLAGDENPQNDTVTSTTTTIDYVWKTYDDLPHNTYSNALVYTEATGTPEVYSLGGRGAYGEIYKFGCYSETWDTVTTSLISPVWMTGGAVTGDKIYAIGGAEGMTWSAVNHNQEYNPISDTVILKAPLTTARYNHGTVVWRDTLIYVMGGAAFSVPVFDDIEIYDPAHDSWMIGSRLPTANEAFACGICDDTIYIAGGRNDTASYIQEAWMGIIDPVSPEIITWIPIPDIPIGISGQPGRASVSGAVCDGHFYIVGGYDHGYYASDAWYYDQVADTWIQLPDKPTGVSACGAVYAPALNQGTFFCAGGDLNNAGVYATEGLTNLTLDVDETIASRLSPELEFTCTPNPASSNLAIQYSIGNPCFVKLKIYDSVGRVVKILVNDFQTPGTHTVRCDIDDMANGVYFLQLEHDTHTATKKIILIK
jgi:hypothetical protein